MSWHFDGGKRGASAACGASIYVQGILEDGINYPLHQVCTCGFHLGDVTVVRSEIFGALVATAMVSMYLRRKNIPVLDEIVALLTFYSDQRPQER